MAPASTTALSVADGPLFTTTLSYLSSRAKSRDLRFRGPFVGMFFSALHCEIANSSSRSCFWKRSA